MAVTSPPMSQRVRAPAPLDASRLRIQKIDEPRTIGWLEDPPQGIQSAGTDHMLLARWNAVDGWTDPQIVPYGDLKIPPTASCLHYATQCFEGMKVYRGYDGKLRLFRPQANFSRLLQSAARVSLPSFDAAELEKLLASLLALDCARWLPADRCRGQSLYLRPAMIADGPTIGVRLPEEALLFIIVVPWPEINPVQVKEGLHLIASQATSIRAWPGGFGNTKVGANYGPSFLSLGEARAQGFDQVLWLFGPEGVITEAGASNFFVVWRTESGRLQLVTPSLDEGLILPGITRDSVVRLAHERLQLGGIYDTALEQLEIVERQFTIAEVAAAKQEGRLLEAFVSGTAYFITPVSKIQWQEVAISIPTPEDSSASYARTIRTWLEEIMYGKVDHPWATKIEEVSQIAVTENGSITANVAS